MTAFTIQASLTRGRLLGHTMAKNPRSAPQKLRRRSPLQTPIHEEWRLRRAGAGTVTAIEPSAFRRRAATSFGADITLDPEEAGTGGVFGTDIEPPVVVYECAGMPDTLELAVDIVRFGGRLILLGIPSEPVNLAAFTVIGKEIDIVGSIIYLDEFPLTIGLLARRAFDVESLISLVLPITRFEETFDALANPVSILKVLLHPTQS